MAQILLVDDDLLLREGFELVLSEEGYNVVTASSGTEALEKLAGISPQCIVMDVRLPGMDGLATLKAMREEPNCPPVLIMTAYGTTDTAIEAMKLGAFDYILKPFEIPRVLALIARAVESGERQKARGERGEAGRDMHALEGLIGSSRPMQELYKAIGRVAPTDALVLLRGESGTGKEVVARSIWRYSPRARKPLAVINCVAIPDSLLESELFGYEKGSFTGAQAARPGRIEQAAGGTVFLDEIGDMPLAVQAKLLRLLQERQIERIGAPNPISVDVRIIAATNVDLEKAVNEGRFREDLYYRLKVVTLWLPPLRNRLGDIPELAMALLARQAEQIGVPDPGIEPDALEYLATLPWPGNVRELSNLLQKLLVFTDGSPICRRDVLRVQDPDLRFSGSRIVQPVLTKGTTGEPGKSLCNVPNAPGAQLPLAGKPASGVEDSFGKGALQSRGVTESVPGEEQGLSTETVASFSRAVLPDSASRDRQDALLSELIDPILAAGGEQTFDACMDLMGRAVVKRALLLTGGNRSRAARLLGLSRPTLLARMERYGLKVETRIN